MDDTEVFARSLVARLGEQAHAYSLVRASQLSGVGDEAGRKSWEAVASRIKLLKSDPSKKGAESSPQAA